MKFVYSPRYGVDIGEHVFATEKYAAVHDELLKRGLAKTADFIEPAMPPYTDFEEFLDPDYMYDLRIGRMTERTAVSELPVKRDVIDAGFLAAEGTRLAADIALKDGVCVHLGGGLHHAYPHHAEGFCYINDLAYAIYRLKREGKIKAAVVIDCDLHQGNGTAFYFKDDPDVFTFSMHQELNYPMPKEKSSLDVGLPDGAGDGEYLDALTGALGKMFADGKTYDIALYQAGVDVYEHDQLGGLKLTMNGLKRRDEMVIGECRKRGIPVAITLGGGYPEDFADLAALHTQTCEVAIRS
ncbi:MAG: histone deacetylase family protein [bacterium]